MTSIDDIILRNTNPFDNIRSVNFWHQQQEPEPIVESIHQEASAVIEVTLAQVAKDHRTRTVMLDGDSGSGKTYLLGRIKKAFNSKAFFAYIPPFPQSDYVWRHILRYTVDSLVQVPDGQTDSQLLLWLKSFLSTLKQRSIKERIFKDDIFNFLRSDRQKFIKQLKDTYKKTGILNISNAEKFFGVLHDLINPKLYPLACEWLRGDDLSEASLQTLKVKSSIEAEETAREMLANLGKIAANTQPIVLCFDQLESLARLPNGYIDLQTLFNVNTKIHGEDKNFLIIISITTNTWNQNKAHIDESHKPRIDRQVSLGLINFEQAESLWASRLYSLHRQANPQPISAIYPLIRQYLAEEFPSGKTNPGDTLLVGRNIFQQYKEWLATGSNENEFKPHQKNGRKNDDLLATFKLKWREEFTKVQQRITQIRLLSSPELIQMLQDALTALQVEEIKIPLFTKTKFASYSLGYQLPGKSGRLGVVWTEDAHMSTFFHVMKACQKAVEKNSSLTLYLIREEKLGNSNNQGYKLFTQIFTGSPHCQIIPNITSIHYLATYYGLVKDAREGDLVIGGQTIDLKNLQSLIRKSEFLDDCPLLQNLRIVKNTIETSDKSNVNGKTNDKANDNHQPLKQVKSVKPPKEVIEAKEYLLESITTTQVMGLHKLIENTHSYSPMVSEPQIAQLIQQLCHEKRVKIINPDANSEDKLICLVPKK